MKFSIVFLTVLFSLSTFGLERVRDHCSDNGFLQGSWQHLVLQEPAIGQAFNKMLEHSGTTKVYNCTVEWPRENGQPVDGLRIATFDQQYYTSGTFRHHGLRIEYQKQTHWDGSTQVINRDVVAFYVCRTPQACRRVGIPSLIALTQEEDEDTPTR